MSSFSSMHSRGSQATATAGLAIAMAVAALFASFVIRGHTPHWCLWTLLLMITASSGRTMTGDIRVRRFAAVVFAVAATATLYGLGSVIMHT